MRATLFLNFMAGAMLSAPAQAASPPVRAEYSVIPARENDKCVARSIALTRIADDASGMVDWQMDIELSAGGRLAIRCTSERLPMTSFEGPGRFKSYQFRDARAKVTAYRHALTGEPVLPMAHFLGALLPTCSREAMLGEGFALVGEYLGQIVHLTNVDTAAAAPAWKADLNLALNPDMLIGILWSMKDDGTGVKADKDYKYLPLSPADYKEMIEAGCNYFGPSAKDRECVQDEPVYYRIEPDFPADLYRSNYAGMDMFIDEPAIRLGLESQNLPKFNHPSEVAELLISRGRALYGRDGLPYTLHNAIKAKWPMGTMDLRIDGIPAWETLYQAAFYEMAGGIGGIVHEGRYQHDDFDWDPSALFGGAVELNPEQALRCRFAVMRGAARAFGQNWGTSIYGQCDPSLRQLALTTAYDMGAKWFWFWSADHEHHLPHADKLKLMRALRDYVRQHPRADLATLRRSAKTAIALPWGYCLGSRSLYVLPNPIGLDALNPQGVPYRNAVAAAAWEGVLCALRGENFDFTVDHSGLDKLGYERIVRVDEVGFVHQWPVPGRCDAPVLQLQVQPGPGTAIHDRELPASRMAGSRQPWAAIVPGSKTTTVGGTLKWQIQTEVSGESLAGMEACATLESFSPLPTARVQSKASFDVSHRLECRDLSVRMDTDRGHDEQTFHPTHTHSQSGHCSDQVKRRATGGVTESESWLAGAHAGQRPAESPGFTETHSAVTLVAVFHAAESTTNSVPRWEGSVRRRPRAG